MTWRLRAGPGSFRGVPFNVESVDLGGGRKIVVHEYPLQDQAFVEDLGRRSRSFAVEAYVVGDDFIDQRDALIEALEREGPGRLALPYIDVETRVFAVARFSVRESREEGGIARLLIELEETTQDALLPLDVPDLTGELDASLEDALDAFQENFETVYDIGGAPPFTFASLSSVVAAAGDAIRTAFAPVTGAIGTVTGAIDNATSFAADIKRQVDALILDADMLVRSPFVVADRFRDLFEAVFESPALPARNIDALLEVYEFQSDTPAPDPVTSNREREAANYVALQSVIKTMAVASAARFAGRAEFESFEQAAATRDRITELLDVEAETATDSVYQAIVDLRAALVAAVPGEGSDLPRLLNFTPPATLPSLVIAHRLHGNVDKELDLVARNKIRHPGFVLGGRVLEVLSDA
jgi:prophage DNA circulation protein